MIKEVNSFFEYSDFLNSIQMLITMKEQENHICFAFGLEANNPSIDAYITLLAKIFPLNEENYNNLFFKYWASWSDMVECAIVSYIYDVLSIKDKVKVLACYNHDLLSIDSVEDEIDINSRNYVICLDSIETLWKICTGEIPVRERFS